MTMKSHGAATAMVISAAGLFATQLEARANVLAYEPFNYTAAGYTGSTIPSASDMGGASGFAANSSWAITHPATIGQPGFTYTNGGTLQTAGNYLSGLAYQTTGINNVQVIRNLSATYGATGAVSTPTSIWGSVIMQADATATTGQYGQLRLMGTANGAFVGIGYSNGGATWSAQGWNGVDSSYPSANSAVSITTQSLLVFQVVLGGGTDTSHYKVNLWVNPTLNADGSLPAADAVLSSIYLANFQFSSMKMMVASGSSGAADPLSVDEIRLGTTAADVLPIPEAASLSLLGASVLLCAARRRSR